MRRICIVGLILLPVILFINGCWDFERLSDRTVIMGIAVDNQDEGYKVAVEIVQFANGGGQDKTKAGKSKVLITTYPKKSLEIPLHDFQTRISGSPFYPNLHILAIGKEQAKMGIAEIISHFIRDPDMRRSTQVVIADDEAIELLGIKSQQESLTSSYLEKLAIKTEKTGKTITSDIGDISRAIHEKSVTLIPLITPSAGKDEAKVVGTAVIEKGKMVDQLSEEETKAVAYVKKPVVESGSLRMDCPQTGKGSVSMDIIKTKASLEPKVKGNRLMIQGKSRVIGYLSEYNCSDGKVQGRTSLERLEEKFTQKLNEEVNAHLTTILHRTGADVLDLHDKLEKKPKEWKKIEKRFSELLRNAEVDINVSVELKSRGTGS